MPMINIEDAYILGETGAQVDKVTGLFTKDEETTEEEKTFAQLNIGASGGGGGGGRNLLDNPFFTVNQLEATTVSAVNAYIADRWLCTYGNGGYTATRESNGSITITPTLSTSYGALRQKLEPTIGEALMGKTVTGSVLLDNGTILTGTATIPSSGNVDIIARGAENISFVWNSTNKQIDIRSYAEAHTIKAVKLELGSVSTLANDAPPNYAEELAKCNFYDTMLKTSAQYGYLGYGIADSATSATILIPLPNNMRDATPTITTNGTIAVKGGTSGTHTMTGITFKLRVTGGVLVTVSTTGLTTGEFCLLQLNNTSSYINLSANL